MDNDSTKDALNNETEIQLMSPDFQIMQDIEEDLEDYSRLCKLGRFGEASRLFRETLHRHLGCFAVLVEHCNVLIDQEDFENAELVLNHSIKRQEMFATGPERFGSSELHLLRLLLIYASKCKCKDGSDAAGGEKATLIKARWNRDSVTVSNVEDLTDVQRQILLTWLRIIFNSKSYKRPYESTEDLRLPWSSRPLYHDDTLTLSEDYIAWFETLVPEHPWDACIVLRYLCYLRPSSLFHQDWSVFLGIINRNFEDSSSVDASLFGHMSLLWTLGEVALMRRCGAFHEEEHAHRYTTVHAVADPESDDLMESIRTILQQHSEILEVTRTRPYKRLQLLLIDHETLRHHQPGDVEIAIEQNLPRLHAIEEFAMSPDIHDHALGIDTLLHYYLFTAAKDIRKAMSNKVAHFSSRFGMTGESMMLHKIMTGSYYNAHSVPNRGHLILLVLGQNPMARVLGRKRSMLQIIFCNSENEGMRSA
ncbi:hypothetical protein D6C90_10419 [Aureobasidium pullulans]|uniref:Uncharacterized protein n=1 Tax=Aureobasidium pullulans TaxID=5580 RepID=A0A4S9SMD1_AURPU|nr:hypothetical protein D6C90_10419 [Aureobasidium pullulans]